MKIPPIFQFKGKFSNICSVLITQNDLPLNLLIKFEFISFCYFQHNSVHRLSVFVGFRHEKFSTSIWLSYAGNCLSCKSARRLENAKKKSKRLKDGEDFALMINKLI